MTDFMALLHNPIFWAAIGGYWVFSAAVGALEAPTANSGPGYKFVFRFLHGLSGNLNRAAMTFKVPGAPEAQ